VFSHVTGREGLVVAQATPPPPPPNKTPCVRRLRAVSSPKKTAVQLTRHPQCRHFAASQIC
jgi:hypothetical protein